MTYPQVVCAVALTFAFTPAFVFATEAGEVGASATAEVSEESPSAGTREAADPKAVRDGAGSKIPPGFEPVEGGPSDTVDANQLVVLAYAAFFALMFGYILWIARDQARMAGELASLAEKLHRPEAGPKGPS